LLDRVGATPDMIPVPTENPKNNASLTPASPKTQRLAAFASRPTIVSDPAQAHMNPLAFTSTAGVVERESVGERADRIFSSVTLSLKSIEREQIEKMQVLAIDAFETASEIDEIIKTAGLPMPALDDTAVGGPFVRPNDPNAFEATLDDLDQALARLDLVRRHASKLPIGYPAPGREITSRFGNRRDPFIGRLAFHGGIDFRTPKGTPIFSSGTGIVVHAGRNGGYGKMVEIDHGNGITTRYAHLSAVEVREGDPVAIGARIGKAGSTGRSTGPHLHYEVRRNGSAVDPIRFLKAAKKLKSLLVSG
jgi:murein DD-endopeptidase MepM/ murein hydrolase activator NlpD